MTTTASVTLLRSLLQRDARVLEHGRVRLERHMALQLWREIQVDVVPAFVVVRILQVLLHVEERQRHHEVDNGGEVATRAAVA